ncbi:MAG: endonuclease V, partial [Planctomycetota bacterium]
TGRVRRVAGADVSFDGERGRAAVVVCDARTFEPMEVRTAEGRAAAPYVPGLLAFREAPLVLEAFSKLQARPDLVFVDGMGRIHPRRFGIACHLGLLLDLPAVGCGKTPFVGTWREPGSRRGSWSEVSDRGERLGAAVRTREGAKPVFVSTGHRISLRTAILWAVRAATAARIPEPIRLAHRAASLARGAARRG